MNRCKMDGDKAVCTGKHHMCDYASFLPGGEFCTNENEHAPLCMSQAAIKDAKGDDDE